MTITKADIIGKIRKAIDDIVSSGITDSFVEDTDAELWQAVFHACTELSQELPLNLLDVSIESLAGTYDSSRGFSYSELPDDYLRFVSIDIKGCASVLFELIEPGSEAEKMQRSVWTRATATKPKAMPDHDEQGNKVIVWWPGGDGHDSAELGYIAAPELTETEDTPAVPIINCSLRDEAERLVIYRAASIFFEGKKEGDIAEKFRNLSNNI